MKIAELKFKILYKAYKEDIRIKRLLGQMRKVIEEYDMVQSGDRIAVGVSGGKDSLTMLIGLAKLRDFYPKRFEIEAITLTLGIGEFDTSPIKKLCEELKVNYTVEETNIGKIIFEERKEKNPCSLCANMRRGALHNTAKKLKCNKVALGHNKDDLIETFMLSLFYEGRIHVFSPVTYLERKELYLIRPLIYVEESEVKSFIRQNDISIVKNPCVANGNTKRQEIKEEIISWQKEKKDIKSNLFGAIKRSHLSGW